MKNVLLLLIMPAFVSQALAQTTLSGNIVDGTGKPIPFASAALLNARDSSVAKSMASDQQGTYLFAKVRAGQYVIRATAVGYQKVHSPAFDVANDPANVPALKLTEMAGQLNTVQVTAKKPFVEQQIDRTVINVSNSIIASGSTALEVLEKAPGVTVDRQNDQLQLRGKDGVIVQIDGKQTYLSMADVMAMLRSMSSDNVERIELITNPSARYDAAGNSGIIDIRLKKNNNVGTNGSVSLAGGSGRYARQRGSLQLNHRTAKVNLFGSYSGNRGGNYWDFTLKRIQAADNDELKTQRNIIDQRSYIRFWERGQNVKAGVDFFSSKSTTIGAVWTGFWSNSREESPAEASFRRQEDGPVYLRTLAEKTLTNVPSNQIGNLNVQHTFGGKGGQLTADVDLGHFSREFTNSLTTQTLYSESGASPLTGLFTHLPTTIDILTGKIDYSRPLTGGWKMEAGLKSSSVRSDNALTLSQGLVGDLRRDDTLSNHFKYTERVNAAYATFTGKVGQKTDIMLGLRAEHTHSVGHSLTLNDKVTRDYLNLFPSLFLSHPLSADHQLTFSYSYRIDRPNYQNLNPARGYLDPYAYSQGNPFLQPQYTQSLELTHSYKKNVFTTLGASFIDDFVFFLIRPVTSNTINRKPENIGQSQAYNLTVSFPVTVMKGWTMQTTLLGTYSQFQFNYLGVAQRVKQVSGRVNASSAFTLGKGWTAELTGWINTPAVRAIAHIPWLGSVDTGIQKAVSARLKAKLSVQDVFHTNQALAKIETPEFTNNLRIRFDTRIALLNLTYSFGNQKLKGERQRRTASDEETRRAN